MILTIELSSAAEEVLANSAALRSTTPECLAAQILNDRLAPKMPPHLAELVDEMRLTPERLAERRRNTIEKYDLDKPDSKEEHWTTIVGKWPGNETDNEITEALEELS